MKRGFILSLVLTTLLSLWVLRRHWRVWLWDRTGSVTWDFPAIQRTALCLFLPELVLIISFVWLYRGCSDEEFRSKLSLRNPVLLLFGVLAIVILRLGTPS